MKRKQSDYENIKDEAVRKASELLQLLSDELEEQKFTTEALRRQLESERILLKTYQERETDWKQANLLKQELDRFREIIEKKSEEHRILVDKNSELHLKISELHDRIRNLTSVLESQRIKYSSLKNQNEYLIKQFSQFKQKQRQIEMDTNLKLETMKRQLNEMASIKNALANRVEELRKENTRIELLKIDNEPFGKIDDVYKGVAEQLKRENQVLQAELMELRRRFIDQENRLIIEEIELSRELNETKKYPTDQLMVIGDKIESVCMRLGLVNEMGSVSHRFIHLSQFLVKHLEYFLIVVIRICCKYLDEKPQHPAQGWLWNIKEALKMSELLLHKFNIY